MSLVDTPGLGEFNSHVEALAKEALKSSSAYVYITTFENLHAQINAECLRFILEHDEGTHTLILINIYNSFCDSVIINTSAHLIVRKKRMGICHLLNKNAAHPANIEFKLEAILSVQVVFQDNSVYCTSVYRELALYHTEL